MSTIFFDIDTQIDFLFPAGALYVPGAECIVETVARLNRTAARLGYALISTADAHAEDDPEFRAWPAHCVAGTFGQRKPASTLLDGRAPLAAGAQAPQLVLEKQHLDCFTNPRLDLWLAAQSARQAVVYGVVTEVCVDFAVSGLLRRGYQVAVVSDAVRELTTQGRDESVARWKSAGAAVISSGDVANA